jgi:hypothetical protein
MVVADFMALAKSAAVAVLPAGTVQLMSTNSPAPKPPLAPALARTVRND